LARLLACTLSSSTGLGRLTPAGSAANAGAGAF
jgi:hypothetical protein